MRSPRRFIATISSTERRCSFMGMSCAVFPEHASTVDRHACLVFTVVLFGAQPMTTSEQQAILSIALLAGFADGANDREREEIRRIAESLAGENGGQHLSTLYQDVLLKRIDVAKAAAALTDPAHKQLAYEMAVC